MREPSPGQENMSAKSGEFTAIAKVDDLKNYEMRRYVVNGKKVLLAKADGSFYAARDRCPHLGAALSKGKLAGTLLTCPLHYSSFDLKTGRVVRWTQLSGVMLKLNDIIRPPRPLTIYPVKVENGQVMVRV